MTSPSFVELWPHFLEKAYAKKYGSYQAIEGGFVDAALSELTNGVPETFDFAEHDNPQKLWKQCKAYLAEGAHLGCGSPSHPEGDRAKSGMGIVQGHAYSLLRMEEVDGVKLIQIRNPHGQGEWEGDWSDGSSLWTTRVRNVLNYHLDADDGLFWMDFSDFMEEFECIYVCRQFLESQGWHCIKIDDEWSGKYAAGLPNKNNRKCKMHENPQYAFNVHEAGLGYVVMRLKERESTSQSKLFGYLNMQDKNGEIITAPSKKLQLGTSGPINSVVRSMPVEFSSKLSYPHKFTLLVANMDAGEAGTGKYAIQFYAKGKTPELEKLN